MKTNQYTPIDRKHSGCLAFSYNRSIRSLAKFRLLCILLDILKSLKSIFAGNKISNGQKVLKIDNILVGGEEEKKLTAYGSKQKQSSSS